MVQFEVCMTETNLNCNDVDVDVRTFTKLCPAHFEASTAHDLLQNCSNRENRLKFFVVFLSVEYC